jgi:hypothetical protein
MSGTVLAVIADTHVGSSTALAPLTFSTHSRNTLEAQVTQANRMQKWLYECWTDYWDYVYKVSKKKRLIVVHCGDIIDGLHHNTMQVMNEVADQAQAAVDLLAPISARAQSFFGILGTSPTHAGQENISEIGIYKELGARAYSQTLSLEIDGKLFDFAHHGRAGRRAWTSSAAGVGAEVIIDYATQGLKPPDYVFRAHNHVLDDSGLKIPGTRSISLPSWQLKTSYGWRISSNAARSDIGGYVVVDGVLDDSKARYFGQPDGRKVIRV